MVKNKQDKARDKFIKKLLDSSEIDEKLLEGYASVNEFFKKRTANLNFISKHFKSVIIAAASTGFVIGFFIGFLI